jgi:hypothetical protein
MILKPGTILTVVFETHPVSEVLDLRSSIVYAIFEKKIIIAQTDPPIPKHLLKKNITLSSITQERCGAVRYGCLAKILEFLEDYRLASSQKVSALLITPQTPSQQYNLRSCYRISPPHRSGLSLSLSWYPLNLLNISIGGLAFSHRYDFKLQQGMVVKLTLNIDSYDYEVEGLIKRISFPGHYHGDYGLEFVSTQFTKMDKRTRHALGRKILNIQRDLRARGFDD